MDAKLDPLFTAATKEGQLPGIAALILDASGNPLYRKAFGVTDLSAESPKDYTPSTPTLIWSCTKLITSIAAVQLIEQGKLSLSDPVEKYVPEIANIKVLDTTNTDSEGNYSTRDAKRKATILHLITHTAGFTYDFFDKDTLTWQIQSKRTPCTYHSVGDFDSYVTPLAHDPGEKYTYGINIDWLGFVIEAITQRPLLDHLQDAILGPLGMKNTGAAAPANTTKMALHFATGEGTYAGQPDFVAVKPDADKLGGGGFLTSTIDDYGLLLTTLLNGGTHPSTNAQILSKDSVDKYIFTDHLPSALSESSTQNAAADVGLVPSSIPQLTLTGQFLPSTKLGWSCGLMLNLEDVPNGRKKGSGAWAGLGNVYYWVDPETKVAGMVMTSILPFFDPKVLELFVAVEEAAYGGEGSVKGFSAP